MSFRRIFSLVTNILGIAAPCAFLYVEFGSERIDPGNIHMLGWIVAAMTTSFVAGTVSAKILQEADTLTSMFRSIASVLHPKPKERSEKKFA